MDRNWLLNGSVARTTYRPGNTATNSGKLLAMGAFYKKRHPIAEENLEEEIREELCLGVIVKSRPGDIKTALEHPAKQQIRGGWRVQSVVTARF